MHDKKKFEEISKQLNMQEQELDIVQVYLFPHNRCEGVVPYNPRELYYIFYLAKLIAILKKGASIMEGEDVINFFRNGLVDKELPRLLIPYDFIAFYVYKDSDAYVYHEIESSFEEIIGYSNNLFFEDKKLSGQEIEEKQRDDIENFFNKIKRHVLLAIHQKQHMLNLVENIKNMVEESKNMVEESKNMVEESVKEIEEIQSKADDVEKKTDGLMVTVHGNFITILGIFSAIIVAVFGGITITGASLSKIENTHSYLLFLSTGLISLFLIIYFLFTWIHQIKQSVGNWQTRFSSVVFLALVLFVLSGIAFYSYKNKAPKIPSKTNTSTEYKLSIEAIDSK